MCGLVCCVFFGCDWYLPQSCFWFPPLSEDRYHWTCYDCLVPIKNLYFFWCEHCQVVCLGKFADTEEGVVQYSQDNVHCSCWSSDISVQLCCFWCLCYLSKWCVKRFCWWFPCCYKWVTNPATTWSGPKSVTIYGSFPLRMSFFIFSNSSFLFHLLHVLLCLLLLSDKCKILFIWSGSSTFLVIRVIHMCLQCCLNYFSFNVVTIVVTA